MRAVGLSAIEQRAAGALPLISPVLSPLLRPAPERIIAVRALVRALAAAPRP
ncbi:MAG TPA: hypothetical protein VF069_29815 [Streptosporangiaceae bacterium]